jgi:hypothetical protein
MLDVLVGSSEEFVVPYGYTERCGPLEKILAEVYTQKLFESPRFMSFGSKKWTIILTLPNAFN